MTNEELRMELLMSQKEGEGFLESRMPESRKAAVKDILGERESYLTRVRGYGQGDVRIGQYLTLNDDMYALGFISQINDTIMDKYFDVLKGELIEHSESESDETPEETTATEKIKSALNNSDDDIVQAVKDEEDEDSGIKYDDFGFPIVVDKDGNDLTLKNIKEEA